MNLQISHFQIVGVSDLVDDVANCTWIESLSDEVFAVRMLDLNRASLEQLVGVLAADLVLLALSFHLVLLVVFGGEDSLSLLN